MRSWPNGGARHREWLCLASYALIACQATTREPPDPVIVAIVAPDGWSIIRGAERAILEDPERALRVVIEASAARTTDANARVDADARDHVDATSAIAHAWMFTRPAMLARPREAREIDEPPPSKGWDAQATIEYSSADGAGPARRSARAHWMRLGAKSYVVLVDGDANAVAKREAQIGTLVDGVKPEGLREEVLVGPTRAIDTPALDAFVDRAMAELDVPGAAIGVIALDSQVAYVRTVGVKEKGKPARITEDTRFLMASVTKPMTSMMQAALVDRGVLRWDRRVTEILPSFALGDPAITTQLELWHMSCACTGMPRQDMEGLFEWSGVTPEARLAAMRTMKPTTKLGETFQYSNPLVAAGGFIAAHALAPESSLSEAYAAAMQATVFDPIGMASTTFDFATVADGDHAMPHALDVHSATRVMPLAVERQVEPIAPAGGAWSTVRDMMSYALTEMREGVSPAATRVVSVDNYRERTKPRIAIGDGSHYGLGIDVETYRGQRLLSHDGGSFGFGTRLWVMPDAKIAIVILTNVRNGNAKEQLPFVEAVTRKVLEELFASARPLADKQLAYYVKHRRREPYVRSEDRSWIARLAGRYREPALGEVEIRATEAGAVFDAGEWRSAMDVIVDADGTARTVMLDPPFAGNGVVIGPGDPPTLIVPDQTTYTFTRVR
ncbi:MAG: serine hydrolase domain-containing protein [Kofleriaceae bacterium]